MSLINASFWIAVSTSIKAITNLFILKILAVLFGPDGIAQIGGFRQLLKLLGILSGAGIFNGVTKLVAEHQQRSDRLRVVIGTGSTIILTFSALLTIIILCNADQISNIFFGCKNYRNVIISLAVIQIVVAYNNLGFAIIKGYRDTIGNALAIGFGSLLGGIVFFVSFKIGGYLGALIGLTIFPAITLFPVLVILYYRRRIPVTLLLPLWNSNYASILSKFTIIALITLIVLPLVNITIRNILIRNYNYAVAGVWQGIISISDTYMQFITALATVYILPTLSKLNNKKEIAKEILRSLKFVLPMTITVSFVLWFLRDFVIKLLFSVKFIGMGELFACQLIGDVLKVNSYIFGYFVIVRAAYFLYLIAELSQFFLLIGFSHWFIPRHGAIGATEAYMSAYVVYFILSSIMIFYHFKKNE